VRASVSGTPVGGSGGRLARPKRTILGANSYPGVDSSQPQRCTFRPPRAALFNRRSQPSQEHRSTPSLECFEDRKRESKNSRARSSLHGCSRNRSLSRQDLRSVNRPKIRKMVPKCVTWGSPARAAPHLHARGASSRGSRRQSCGAASSRGDVARSGGTARGLRAVEAAAARETRRRTRSWAGRGQPQAAHGFREDMGQTLPERTTRSEVVRGFPVKHLRNSVTQGL
jgi:hypothetical protein